MVAARLSDADPELSILVVERGPNNLDDPTVTNPLYFIENILNLGTGSQRMMYYEGQPEESIAGRAMTVPAGSILGGGSSINMLTYTRPQRGEMDDWNMPGWAADDVIPYLKKVSSILMKTHANRHSSKHTTDPAISRPTAPMVLFTSLAVTTAQRSFKISSSKPQPASASPKSLISRTLTPIRPCSVTFVISARMASVKTPPMGIFTRV